ncbi:hypothetical protein RB595_008551 [Gaeumannomyces hyphopodioides]
MASINDLATAAIASSAVEMAKRSSSSAADGGGGGGAVESAGRQPAAGAAASIPQPPEVIRGALIALEGLDRSGKTTQVKLLEQRFVELGRKVKVMRFPGGCIFICLFVYFFNGVLLSSRFLPRPTPSGILTMPTCNTPKILHHPRIILIWYAITDRTTPIGEMIDGYLKSQVDMDDHVIHLLFSANRWEAVKTITSLLASGTTVVCDRYYHSGIVYSAAKRNPTLTLPWARAPEVGLPRPDLVLFLDLDEGQARARGGWGGEAYERGEMQRRVRELFWGLSMGRIELTGEAAAAAAVVSELRFRQEEEDLHVVDASPSVEDVAEEIWKVVRPRVEAVERGEVGRTVRKVS